MSSLSWLRTSSTVCPMSSPVSAAPQAVGVTAFDGSDAGPGPTALIAFTVKV